MRENCTYGSAGGRPKSIGLPYPDRSASSLRSQYFVGCILPGATVKHQEVVDLFDSSGSIRKRISFHSGSNVWSLPAEVTHEALLDP